MDNLIFQLHLVRNFEIFIFAHFMAKIKLKIANARNFSMRRAPLDYFFWKIRPDFLFPKKIWRKSVENSQSYGLSKFLKRGLAGCYVATSIAGSGDHNFLQIQPIDLKFSTHLNEAKTGTKFEDGQNRTKKFVISTSSNPKVGLWSKKIILSEWPEIWYTSNLGH